MDISVSWIRLGRNFRRSVGDHLTPTTSRSQLMTVFLWHIIPVGRFRNVIRITLLPTIPVAINAYTSVLPQPPKDLLPDIIPSIAARKVIRSMGMQTLHVVHLPLTDPRNAAREVPLRVIPKFRLDLLQPSREGIYHRPSDSGGSLKGLLKVFPEIGAGADQIAHFPHSPLSLPLIDGFHEERAREAEKAGGYLPFNGVEAEGLWKAMRAATSYGKGLYAVLELSVLNAGHICRGGNWEILFCKGIHCSMSKARING
mmetsp:Transcript_48014/g.71170  ORF Transcript_48014/g.71170 Transcript_48014/m.71170 type:complete len:257 (-) Transcript_48014:257-1027(-)